MILLILWGIGSRTGVILGYPINNARDFMRPEINVVCLIVSALPGLGAEAIVRALERDTLARRPSFIKS